MSEPTGAPQAEESGIEPIEVESRRWVDALEAEIGPLALFDTHTHFGRNDPDEYRQEPEQLIATMEYAGARAITFPMHEPDGYPAANDEAREIEAGAGGRIVHFCRVNPHDGAPAEAERCLDLGAHGIKLHPRAEQFAMSEAAVEDLTRLAEERDVPILIHAGRGIPALGRDTLELAQRYPGARFILAHAAVSDLAWLWRLMPDNPNLFIDTSWWNPADFVALFSLVPPGQILWASDNPYGHPLHAAAFQLRYALAVGMGGEQIRSIAGEQIERILAHQEPAHLGPAARPARGAGSGDGARRLPPDHGGRPDDGGGRSERVGRAGPPGGRPRGTGGRDRAGDPAPARPRRPARRPAAPRPPLPPLRPVRDVGAGRGPHPRHRPAPRRRLSNPRARCRWAEKLPYRQVFGPSTSLDGGARA